MRSYRVALGSSADTMEHTVVADWYGSAEAKAARWADQHPDHGKHGPWTALSSEVTA